MTHLKESALHESSAGFRNACISGSRAINMLSYTCTRGGINILQKARCVDRDLRAHADAVLSIG